jgi:GNAT superfamily N-acetyltransferase
MESRDAPWARRADPKRTFLHAPGDPIVPSDAILIRPAHSNEAPPLSELALRSKAHWGYDRSFMGRCRDELTVATGELANTFVLEAGGLVRGFYTLESHTSRTIELAFLFVDPPSIGCGFGRALLLHAVETARAAGAEVIKIVGDPNARAFYEAAGAHQVAEQASASIPGRSLPVFELVVALLGART